MARQLKRWESPRKEGRNNKGKGGSARQRQLKKQAQMLRKKLKGENNAENNQDAKRGNVNFPLFFSTRFFLNQDLRKATVKLSL